MNSKLNRTNPQIGARIILALMLVRLLCEGYYFFFFTLSTFLCNRYIIIIIKVHIKYVFIVKHLIWHTYIKGLSLKL